MDISVNLNRFKISYKASIRDAMVAINENYREVVLVADASDDIVGVITDGDIRRGLLRGLTLQSSAVEVMSKDFVSVRPEVDRAAVLDLMKALVIRQIPVLTEGRSLAGIHFLEELIGVVERPNVAVIMAGGKGLRLRPLTENLPKPMIQVAGRPILERIVLHFVGYGIRHIYISINYLGHLIEEHFGDGSAFGCRIEYLREEISLGTGGALTLLPFTPTTPILVMNGDQITRIDIDRLLAFHEAHEAKATIVVGSYEHQIPFGVINHENGRLSSLVEKPTIDFFISQGIYVLNPEVLSCVPCGCNFPITQLFEELLARNQAVAVYHAVNDWVDIGSMDDFRKASGLT
jgi:dTDP-glucose pyrophosphorylase